MIGCQHQIKQWHQAATYGLEGEAKFDTSGALMHLNDIEALKPESGAHQQLPKLAAGEKIYGSSLLTDPAKHNHLHFCYFVHAVGTAANAVISRDVPQKEQHAREEYLRHRSIRFFHPEACGDTNALCMSLVNQDTKQGIYGNVGYIFAPAEGRIAYAAKEDMKTKNWDENSILRTIAAMSSEGRTPVMPAEKLLEKGLSQQNSAEQHNEVLVWGNHSKAGHFQSHDESLIPIGTFSVL
ncbi:MAG TPA: hypothetical protein DHW71_04075, partial [Gammaproteobacteria bacterium]|nr:hypothetical protein [Gammaproteobacteria bacterium]